MSKMSFTERSQSTLQMPGTVDGWLFPEETVHAANGQMLLWLLRPNTEKFGYSVRTSSFFASQVPVITGTQK